MKRLVVFLSAMILAVTVAIASKSPNVTLVSKQYKQVKYVDRQGRIKVKLKDIDKVLPGDSIEYRNVVSNFESKPLKKLVLNNKVPANTKYIKHSAKCSTKCRVLVSVDGGRTFINESRTKGKKVTNIRWILQSDINPNSQAYVSYATKIL